MVTKQRMVQWGKASALGLIAGLLCFVYVTVVARAGIQECTTECQLKHTKCVEDCEQDTPCALRCGQEADKCVARCKEKKRVDSGDEGDSSGKDTVEESLDVQQETIDG